MLQHGAMFDYGEGLQVELTLGELINALEMYKKSHHNDDTFNYFADFLKSGAIKATNYKDHTAQEMYVNFAIPGQPVESDNTEARDITLLTIYEDSCWTDFVEARLLDSYKNLEACHNSKYALEFFKDLLITCGDIFESEILGKSISVGKGDIYQNPESYNPKNKLDAAFWIRYDNEWIKVLDTKFKSLKEIFDYLSAAKSIDELSTLILNII